MQELIIWDGQRLSMPIQRQYQAAIQEVRGHRVMTVPSAAEQSAPLVDTNHYDESREIIVREIERRRTQAIRRHGRDTTLDTELQLWWLEEWTRPDGLYGVRHLKETEMERYETLIEEIPLEAFTGASDRESVATAGDTQIVCETLAIDARLLLTHDTNIMRPEKLLPWTRTLAKSGYISDEKPIEEADEANERWVDETPEDMLVATIVCAWPTETEAVPTAMGDWIDTLLGKLALARLERTSRKLMTLFQEADNLADLIEKTARQGLVKMRNAERRRPVSTPRQGPALRCTGARWVRVRLPR